MHSNSFYSTDHPNVTKHCFLWVSYSLTDDYKNLYMKWHQETQKMFDKAQSRYVNSIVVDVKRRNCSNMICRPSLKIKCRSLKRILSNYQKSRK